MGRVELAGQLAKMPPEEALNAILAALPGLPPIATKWRDMQNDPEWLKARQRRRMRMRYLRQANLKAIRMVTDEELCELNPRRARRILASGGFRRNGLADFYHREAP